MRVLLCVGCAQQSCTWVTLTTFFTIHEAVRCDGSLSLYIVYGFYGCVCRIMGWIGAMEWGWKCGGAESNCCVLEMRPRETCTTICVGVVLLIRSMFAHVWNEFAERCVGFCELDGRHPTTTSHYVSYVVWCRVRTQFASIRCWTANGETTTCLIKHVKCG